MKKTHQTKQSKPKENKKTVQQNISRSNLSLYFKSNLTELQKDFYQGVVLANSWSLSPSLLTLHSTLECVTGALTMVS